MLDTGVKDQLRVHLARIVRPVVVVATLDESNTARSMRALLTEIASLSERIRIEERHVQGDRVPSFSIGSPGEPIDLAFAGVPMGPQFSSLVLALLQVGGVPPREDQPVLERASRLEGAFGFETYFAQDCQSCPETVQALNLLAILNPGVRHVVIDGALFPDEVEQRQVLMVPKIYLNGEFFASGRMVLGELLDMLDTRSLEAGRGT